MKGRKPKTTKKWGQNLKKKNMNIRQFYAKFEKNVIKLRDIP